MGVEGAAGERFLDNARIEGNISDMLTEAIDFVNRNTRRKTIVDPQTGKRMDRPEYPTIAIREAVLNALVHRDYSLQTEGMPIQLQVYSDRVEIQNPGGIYGRIRIDQLGKVQPDTRNPVLASALETMGITENRYSGIPTIRRTMREYGLEVPEFKIERGNFIVRFYRHNEDIKIDETMERVLDYCSVPRTKKEISQYLEISTEWYADKKYITPLVEAQRLGVDESGGKRKKKYYTK
jgi:ATP-dependent DNA helicase RecG